MAYLKSLERLKNLPDGDRQLAAGSYVFYKSPNHQDPECGCVAGKLLPSLYNSLLRWNEADANSMHSIPYVYVGGLIGSVLQKSSRKVIEDINKDMAELELTVPELITLQDLNDRFRKGCNDVSDRRLRYYELVWFLETAAARNLGIGEAFRTYGW